jgi:hypothetical protein
MSLITWIKSFKKEPTEAQLIAKAEKMLHKYKSYMNYQFTLNGAIHARELAETATLSLNIIKRKKSGSRKQPLVELIGSLKKMNKMPFM